MFRAHCKVCGDGKGGYLTISDLEGGKDLKREKVFVCRSSIAVTTTFDIAEGKAIRKLEVGEAFELLEGPREDSMRSLLRIRGRFVRDRSDGWVTIRGSEETFNMEECASYFSCVKDIALETPKGTRVLRTLRPGDLVEVIGEPVPEEQQRATLRVRGRCLGDSVFGWVTLTIANALPWMPRYRCVQGTVLHEVPVVSSASVVVRNLEAGENLEALAAPFLEASAGVVRVRARAERDGAVGFVTIRGDKGTEILETVLAST